MTGEFYIFIASNKRTTINKKNKPMKKIFFLIFLIVLTVALFAQKEERPEPQPAPETFEAFKLGIAGFTFYKFDLDKTLETLKRCDVHYLCIKDFHLPVESTKEEIEAFHAKLKKMT